MVETVPFLNFRETIGVLAALVFVLTSMLGMGFSLTVPKILSPLHNLRLVILSLAANFILVPFLAIGVLMVFPLSEGLSIWLFFLGLLRGSFFAEARTGGKRGRCVCRRANGAPDGDDHSLRTEVLPLLIYGVTINLWDIAKSLILLMLFPLAVVLFIRARKQKDSMTKNHLLTNILVELLFI